MRAVWSGQPYDFQGEHYEVGSGLIALPPDPLSEFFFGSSSGAAGPVAAAYADVYLTWGEPPWQVKVKIDWLRRLAEEWGRMVRFGIRLHVIARGSAREAWATADRLVVAPNLWAGIDLVRGGHRARGQPRGRGQPDRGVPRPGRGTLRALGLSASGIWRRRTGSVMA